MKLGKLLEIEMAELKGRMMRKRTKTMQVTVFR